MAIRVTCPRCHKTFRTKDENAGKNGKCAGCGTIVAIPRVAAGTAPPSVPPTTDASPFAFSAPEARPAQAAKSTSDSPAQKGKKQVTGPAGKRCPSCRANMSAKDVICVECGFDVRKGNKVASAGARGPGRQKVLLFAGLGAGVFIAAAIALIVFLSGGPPQTSKGPSSGPAQEAARLQAEQENGAARQAEAARLKAEQDKEAARQADAARLKADKEKQAMLRAQVPSWQTDFEVFIKTYQQLAAKDYNDARRMLSGHAVRWSLTFKAVHPGDGHPYIEFDSLVRNLGGTGGLKGPVAWFEPAPASLEKWQGTPKGTRVTFTGRVELFPSVIDSNSAFIYDPRTAQKAPTGACITDVAPTQEGELSLNDIEGLLKPAAEKKDDNFLKIAMIRMHRALGAAEFIGLAPVPEPTGPFKVAIKTGMFAKVEGQWNLQLEFETSGKQPEVDGFAVWFGVNDPSSIKEFVEIFTKRNAKEDAEEHAKKQLSMCEEGFHGTTSLFDSNTGINIDSISGVKGLKKSVPGAVNIALGDKTRITGPAPVMAQVYSLKQGKWEPQSEVFKANVQPGIKTEAGKAKGLPAGEGKELLQVQPGIKTEAGKEKEVQALNITDVQPVTARKSKQDVCIVKVEGGDSIGVKHALLYSIYTGDIPDKLKKLDPGLLKQGFESPRIQISVGPPEKLSVAGFISYTKKIPNEVLLSLGQKQSVTGAVGVTVQIWHLRNGKWEPRSKVFEKTIQLE